MAVTYPCFEVSSDNINKTEFQDSVFPLIWMPQKGPGCNHRLPASIYHHKGYLKKKQFYEVNVCLTTLLWAVSKMTQE